MVDYGLSSWCRDKKSTTNAADIREVGSVLESGRSPGVGNSKPAQYSCQENSMNRGAWWATVHGVTKNWTRLSNCTEVMIAFALYVVQW